MAAPAFATNASAQLTTRPLPVRTNRPGPTFPVPDVTADLAPMPNDPARQDQYESGAYYTLKFVNNGSMSIGNGYPLAPSYLLTVSAPAGIVVSCQDNDEDGKRDNVCHRTITESWRSGQPKTCKGEVYPAEAGRTLTFSITSKLPDPDGCQGTLVIPPE